jgi:hypothetical protein
MKKTKNKSISKSERDMWDMLEKINIIMWESFMIKEKGFKESDGFKIMNVLEEWAKKY